MRTVALLSNDERRILFRNTANRLRLPDAMCVFWLLDIRSTINGLLSIKCRNIEYALDALRDIKSSIEEAKDEENKQDNAVVESLKLYELSLNRCIEQQNQILQTIGSTIVETKKIISGQAARQEVIEKQNEILLKLFDSTVLSNDSLDDNSVVKGKEK